MNHKKLISIFTLVCFLFTFIPTAAFAQDDSSSVDICDNAELSAKLTEVLDELQALKECVVENHPQWSADTWDYAGSNGYPPKDQSALRDFLFALAHQSGGELFRYLYYNSDKLVGFFEEYGDEMVDLMEEYGPYVLCVMYYIAENYGCEILYFVMENHEEIIGVTGMLLSAHGETAAKLINVYAEYLGWCDEVRDVIADIEAEIDGLYEDLADLKAELADRYEDLKELYEELENASDELKAEIEAAIEEIEAVIAEIEETIAEIEAAIEELEAQLEAAKEELEKAIEAVEAVVEAIEETVKSGVETVEAMGGYPDGTFGPDKQITRGEVAAVFARLMADKAEAGKVYTSTFTDVPARLWSANAIGFAQEQGIIKGYADGTYRPEQPTTLAEFVAMATRFEAVTGYAMPAFKDVPSTHWAANVINLAAAKDWVGGYEDGTFRPENNITRAEATVILCNVLGIEANVGYITANVADLTSFSDVTKAHWAYWDIMAAVNGNECVK